MADNHEKNNGQGIIPVRFLFVLWYWIMLMLLDVFIYLQYILGIYDAITIYILWTILSLDIYFLGHGFRVHIAILLCIHADGIFGG